MAVVLERLRDSAVHGLVPQHVFAAAVGELALDTAATSRFRATLLELKLEVEDPAGFTAQPTEHEGPIAPVSVTHPHIRAVPQVVGGADSAVPLGSLDPGAVAAARRLLDDDHRRLRPQKRILTAQEEAGLFVLLRGADEHLDDVPEEADLAALPREDLRRCAFEAFVLHNQGLVHNVVRGGPLDQGLEYDDLVQYGIFGVMRAACKFDARTGYKFSTYATWWIRQALNRAVADHGTVIRIPVHLFDTMRKVAATEARLRSEGLAHTSVDVAIACNLEVVKVEEVRKISRVTDSLDRVVGEGLHLGELLSVSDPAPGPEEVLRRKWSREYFEQVLTVLTPREADVLRRRLGVIDGEQQTLGSIGDEFGVSRERIRQIESKAITLLHDHLCAVDDGTCGHPARPLSKKSTGPAGDAT
ncbi:sigma-70 family RNA polymerase sigma factor [Kitasatospora kazusensis]